MSAVTRRAFLGGLGMIPGVIAWPKSAALAEPRMGSLYFIYVDSAGTPWGHGFEFPIPMTLAQADETIDHVVRMMQRVLAVPLGCDDPRTHVGRLTLYVYGIPAARDYGGGNLDEAARLASWSDDVDLRTELSRFVSPNGRYAWWMYNAAAGARYRRTLLGLLGEAEKAGWS